MRPGRLREVIIEGEYYGMQTFDQALLRHYQAGRVSLEDALQVATSPHDFKLLVAAEGRTATTMDDLDDASGPRPPSARRRSAGRRRLRSRARRRNADTSRRDRPASSVAAGASGNRVSTGGRRARMLQLREALR